MKRQIGFTANANELAKITSPDQVLKLDEVLIIRNEDGSYDVEISNPLHQTIKSNIPYPAGTSPARVAVDAMLHLNVKMGQIVFDLSCFEYGPEAAELTPDS